MESAFEGTQALAGFLLSAELLCVALHVSVYHPVSVALDGTSVEILGMSGRKHRGGIALYFFIGAWLQAL